MDEQAESVGLIMVDDNVPAAEAMRRWCGDNGTLRWLGSAEEGEAAAALVARHRPAVVLLDVEMPGTDTFALLPRLAAESPETAVVMFSGHCQPDVIGRALAAGAAGYILKDEPMASIGAMLRRAGDGEFVMSAAAAAAYVRAAENGEDRTTGAAQAATVAVVISDHGPSSPRVLIQPAK